MFWRHNWLGITWAICILILSGTPGSQFESSAQENIDKVVHLVLFGVLFLLLSVGFIKQSRFPFLRRQTLLKVGAFCLGYGILLELLQGMLFVSRSIEFMDIVFNGIGIATGLGLFVAIYGWRPHT